MKKAWQEPTLEVLDINMTMWNLQGRQNDGAWTEHISNQVPNPSPTDPGAMSEAMMS